jgi:hypothetical protein
MFLTIITFFLAVSNLSAATLYVSLESTNATPPYTNWATAAAGIGQAVSAARVGDEAVVGDGVYLEQLAVYTPLAVRSLNGPQFTVIDGGGTNQCAYLADGASLSGFTLTNGMAPSGGGVFGGTLYNCILYFNLIGGNYGGGTLNYCCPTPMPGDGVGNITGDPLYLDHTNGNLRLQTNSPCINARDNASVTASTDLDGRPRIVGGMVDIGAYELQTPASVISYAWLRYYGLPTDGSADYADLDHDGLNNWQEWGCGTDPANALSVLRLPSPSVTRSNATVTWGSVAGITYFLERGTNQAALFALLATNIVSQTGTTSFSDTNAAGPGPFFCRVSVKPY